ncbi:hypothetical protein GH714_003332 [Hevea brasiliensis]|uniref:Uncharacterized protein n=1 Tax=Hevea brasiliensis TaxID=3981 RepID=A0A6A6LZX3_HEVBR|nr:hypothetical protein GH714_003332 [Hevea brasiliensis]
MAGSGGTKTRTGRAMTDPVGPNALAENVARPSASAKPLRWWGSRGALFIILCCPFIDAEFDCQKYGRPDTQYLKYSWQPESCNLPRFNGVDFLRRWRGKKIMFVGDSLSLNMWESLSCMIHASVPNAKATSVKQDSLHSVTFEDYGVTLFVYRTPYLVDIVRESVGRVLKLNSIEAGKAWKGMDLLIFNSWHWWTHTGKSQPWDYVSDGSAMYKDMNRLDAFYRGMSTWARWVDLNVDTSKTKVFFQGISPTHYEGREWKQPKNNCNGQAEPLSGSTYPGGAPPAVAVVKKFIDQKQITGPGLLKDNLGHRPPMSVKELKASPSDPATTSLQSGHPAYTSVRLARGWLKDPIVIHQTQMKDPSTEPSGTAAITP